MKLTSFRQYFVFNGLSLKESRSRHIRPVNHSASTISSQSLPNSKKSPNKVLLQQELAIAVPISIKVLSDTVLGTFAKTKVPIKHTDVAKKTSIGIHTKESSYEHTRPINFAKKKVPHLITFPSLVKPLDRGNIENSLRERYDIAKQKSSRPFLPKIIHSIARNKAVD